MYVKLKTAYGADPAKIDTPFYRKATKGEKECTGKNIVNVKDPLEYLRKKCTVIGGITIDSVFIGSIIESIVTKLAEVLVVEKLDYQSIMSDIELEADSGEEEDEEEDEKQQRKTIKVKRVEDEDDDEDDDD